MQISGLEAIRTQIQPSKPKREITNITKSQNSQRLSLNNTIALATRFAKNTLILHTTGTFPYRNNPVY